MIPLLFFVTIGNMTLWQIYYRWERFQKYNEALKYSLSSGKPLLNVGCGNNVNYVGDINLDVQESVLPNFIQHDLSYPLPFGNKQFGSAIAFHVVEHVDDPQFLISELNRVSNSVYIAVPHWLDVYNWLNIQHKWIFAGSTSIQNDAYPLFLALGGLGLIYLSSRGK